MDPKNRSQGPVKNFQPAIDTLAEEVGKSFSNFLKTFKATEDAVTPTYFALSEPLRLLEKTTLEVDFEHIVSYDVQLANRIQTEYYRFEPFLRKTLSSFVQTADGTAERREVLFHVSIKNLPNKEKLRDLRSSRIGTLACFSGTVTRTSEVRPELFLGVFACLECGQESEPVQQQFAFTYPSLCRNPACQNRKKWSLVVDRSTFVDFQKVKVQENSSEIPSGSMPRTIDVILRNDIVEGAKAGDKCWFNGTFIVVPDVSTMTATTLESSVSTRSSSNYADEGVTGLKALGVRDMTYKTSFLAISVEPVDPTFGASMKEGEEREYTDEEKEEFLRMAKSRNFFARMARSMAPAIFGHDDIKKGLLLMLLGGVHKKTPEGLSLRGDINVCIVGDPSCAKSQFLKYISQLVPRAVYTSGKASSAAGLTATVVKDAETGEFCIEAGALILADNSICCIDEFDKMDPKDQTAIHEAMEQQTISIAKAGIRASLNARASVLAAANPISGRYDESKSLRANLSLSDPILSRFDLFFLLVDKRDDTQDLLIARHVVKMHQNRGVVVRPDYTTEQIREFIKFAKTFKPMVTLEAHEILKSTYRKLRQNDQSKLSLRVTVRQLESIIRLSEAIARLYLSTEVTAAHVNEATEIIRKSNQPITRDSVELVEQIEGGEENQEGGEGDGDHNMEGDVDEEIAKLQEQLDEKNAAREKLRQDEHALKAEIAQFQKELDQLQEESMELEGDFSEDIAKVEREKAAKERQLEATRSGIESLISEITDLAGRIDALKNGGAVASKQAPSSKTTRHEEITFDKYNKISNSILAYLRRQEKSSGQHSTQAQLIDWFVANQMGGGDVSEEAQKKERLIVGGVIRRMVSVDSSLMVVEVAEKPEDRKLAVHPNYNME